MSTLITAFDPFDGRQNSSEELLKSLQEHPPASFLCHEVDYHVFPCAQDCLNECSLGERVRELIAVKDRRVIILMGQAARRDKLSLERVALNLCNQRYGACSYHADAISTSGPPAYFSNFPDLEGFYESLGELNKEVEISNHAGVYLCNEVYFEALHLLHSQGKKTPTLFVHVPLFEEQAKERGESLSFISKDLARQVIQKLVDWAS